MHFSILIFFIVLFIYLVYKRFNPPLSTDGESELNVYKRNKTLPNLTFQSSPTIGKRLSTYLMTVMMVILLSTLASLSVVYSIFILTLIVAVILMLGIKFVSFMEFTYSGIVFYTWLYKYAHIGGKFYIPYEQCRIEYSIGLGRGVHDEGIFFLKGKMPYVTISRNSWMNNWDNIIAELHRRVPQSHFHK